MENGELFFGYSDELLNFASVMCIIFILIGIPGNLITILALWKSNKVRNATAICIINLSLSDLLFCCFNLPLAASTFLQRSWNHGTHLCRLFPLMRYGLLAVSLFTILLITTNRYVMIGHPRVYQRIYRNRNLAIMIAATWIGAFSFLIPTYRGIWGAFGLDVQIGSCSIVPDKNGNSPKEILFVMAFVVPCFCIVVCYARIFYIVRKAALKSREPINMSSSQRIGKSETLKVNNHLGQHLNENHCKVIPKNEKQSSSVSYDCSSSIEDESEKQQQWQMRPFLSKIRAEDIKFIDTSIESDYPSTLYLTQVEGKYEKTLCNKNHTNNTNNKSDIKLDAECDENDSGYAKEISENINMHKEDAVVTEIPLKANDTLNEPDEKRRRFSSKILKTSFNRVATRRNRNNSTINNSNTSVLYPGRMSQKDKRLLKMILVIFLSFVICYLPITVTKIWKEVTKLHWLNISGYLLIYLTTCINPIIYVVMSSEYRQAYWNLLLCKIDNKSTKNTRNTVVRKRTSNVKAQL